MNKLVLKFKVGWLYCGKPTQVQTLHTKSLVGSSRLLGQDYANAKQKSFAKYDYKIGLKCFCRCGVKLLRLRVGFRRLRSICYWRILSTWNNWVQLGIGVFFCFFLFFFKWIPLWKDLALWNFEETAFSFQSWYYIHHMYHILVKAPKYQRW